jgi:hypothetical protein
MENDESSDRAIAERAIMEIARAIARRLAREDHERELRKAAGIDDPV